MKIDILSLFPQAFTSVLESSIVARAIASKALEVGISDFRAFSGNKHNQVDDYAFGGFPGMVIRAEPIYKAIEELLTDGYAPVVYFTPQGRVLNQKILEHYSSLPRVILICGHYKEIDQRLRDLAVCDEISLGDYVLSGGEIPALAFIDGVARLLPGVLGDIGSAEMDSFAQGKAELGFPCYTRPEEWMSQKVPPVLREGNHAKIQAWAQTQSQSLTKTRRPDLKREK
ncbi:MAG: tRNA (guanosine(37)-N1)-methyltransferase TrmD [Candidatus Cloacimonadaceae bacterium]|jgi:tRNA (guanine37-N1)-methyltransferase|nr:tRNA (guanosine(37)-N1)-methyltransferase TrmD [Candidatus Cloacimonadota bacterium]MDX9949069.1 tRNA (guanosine(37)-N1)-methyltransferase TrmD [Candidatus Syntrophosphaera sp.]NLN84748.1 tRNA (guanosine(37)-N1)-methyltransferase TrmD [Candidatus Cloacimonadota bacterium]